MKKLAIVTKVVVFFIIGVVLFFLISPIFVPKTINKKNGFYRTIIQGFYQEPENSLDAVFVGDSSIYRAISPIIMWEEYGFTSYDFASPAQKIWDSYYCIKEVFKYQKPKIIVLHIDAAFHDYPMNEFNKRHLYDNMPTSINKVEAIIDPVQKNKGAQLYDLIFPIFRFHSRWSELNSDDFEYAYTKMHYCSKGYLLAKGKKPYKGEKDYMKKKLPKNKLGKRATEYLIKIKELCEENNAKLALIENPAPNVWNLEKNREITKLATRYEIPFLDLNMKLEELGIDWNQDTHDKGEHMNLQGAEKVSKYIGKYLKENYQLPDHRREKKYEQWWQDTSLYKEKIRTE